MADGAAPRSHDLQLGAATVADSSDNDGYLPIEGKISVELTPARRFRPERRSRPKERSAQSNRARPSNRNWRPPTST